MGPGFAQFLLRRIAGFAGVLLVLALIIFVLARVVPGDPARIALGPTASDASSGKLEKSRARRGEAPLFPRIVSR